MLKEILEEILQTVQRIESRQISTTSPYLSVSEVADYLKISESSMRRLLRNGKIPYQRININESNTRNSSKILITRKHLDQFVFYGEQKDVSKKDIEKIKQWIW
jgi:Mn-dependent DtxR family transcriptional regulator